MLILVALLLLLSPPHPVSSATVTSTSAGHAIPFPHFEHLNIKQSIAATKLRPLAPTTDQYSDSELARKPFNNNSSVKLNLIHRDKLAFSWHKDHRRRLEARMKRDAKRVATLIRRLSGSAAPNYEVEDFGSEVVSGMEQGSGEYFVRIGVGSPARSQYMVMDSGSDIVWVQCQPCSQCYHQSDPVFDPADSASFAGVSCSSSVCDQVENSGCHAGRCKYEVSYGDGSYTKGTVALETLTIGHTMVQNVAIGCGHMNRGMFIGAAGLLGLGRGSMSLVGQLGGQTGGAFSYCLVSRGTGSYGSLEFGRSVIPVGASWVPLLQNLHAPVNSSSENKEAAREEREPERWGNEKKEPQKEKEKIIEKEKDNVKKELWNGLDKEASHNEKELAEITEKSNEQENSTQEPKKKDHDLWKNILREVRDKKKERDADVEPERPEKRIRYHEKESDDGGIHVEGGADHEREVLNSGIQQRKRMLRPRGSPQMGNRDSRVRSGAGDNDGSQGKAVVYKIGECMQELIKLWKEYELSQADKACEGAQNGPTLEICIPAEHVTATNRQVRGGQLWGTDVYTVDSDLVAVLMHTGYCRPTASPPPPAAQELRATIRVLQPQDCYISTLRNNVRSRAWGAAIGCSYRVERCCIVKKGGGIIDLEPCLTHSSTMEPTLAPVAVERTMTTRAAASNALRQQRFVREVTIQFNLCMEPWLKYSISAVADKGLKKSLFTSARLKKGEVLYVETHSRRYELCFNGEKVIRSTIAPHTHGAETGRTQTSNSHLTNGERNAMDGESTVVDIFRWSRCKRPLPQKSMQSIGIPLPLQYVEVMAENLEWDDISWSQTGAWIGGREYHLARAHFLSQN